MKVENSINPLDIAVSGIKSQDKSVKAIMSNIANSRTTDAGNGQPYRMIEAILKAAEDDEIGGVEIEEIAEDTSDFIRVLSPGHPQADENGYLAMPNVDLPTEMMNLNLATKAYQANAAVLKRYQSMVNTSLELLR